MCLQEPCPNEASLGPLRHLAISLFTVFGIVLYLFLCWRPVFVGLDFFFAHSMSYVMSFLAYGVCLSNSSQDGAGVMSTFTKIAKWVSARIQDFVEAVDDTHAAELIKITLMYLQQLGTFSIYNVEWPAAFQSLLTWASFFTNLNFFSIPTLSCLWHGVSLWGRLRFFTQGPLVVYAGFGLPVVVAYMKGLRQESGARWRSTLDRFWSNTMFVSHDML